MQINPKLLRRGALSVVFMMAVHVVPATAEQKHRVACGTETGRYTVFEPDEPVEFTLEKGEKAGCRIADSADKKPDNPALLLDRKEQTVDVTCYSSKWKRMVFKAGTPIKLQLRPGEKIGCSP